MFCPKCGSLMIPNKRKYICNNCGHEILKNGQNERITAKSSDKEVIMVAEEINGEPLDSDAVCPKCSHTGAYYLLKQTRSADEPETKFYTCAKCHHRWREY